MTHLTADELIDAMEGMLDAARQAHLDTCEQCRGELAELSSVLREARAVDMPEPSPIFWQHFSQRVRTAIEAEALPSSSWAGWLRWPVLVPLGAAALLVIAMMLRAPTQGEPVTSLVLEYGGDASSATADDIALADDRWVLVADIVGEMDWDTASAAGLVVEPGAAERAVLELSADEQRELTRLLRAELQRAKS
ncbi:MAG: hypothetical protein Q7R30_20370 [Acidobacteriota bacterium]|nr:hypothetical protein [Acidobacteriota bacterium]